MSASASAFGQAVPARVGGASLRVVRGFGRATRLLGQALAAALRPPFVPPRELARQAYEIGTASIPVVAVTGLFSGMVLALQSSVAFSRFGAESLVGTVVSLAVVRELGPVLTGLMVAGRAGSAMAAELGSMRISDQIDALVTLGTNPVRWLVLPRVLAATAMLPCLVLVADLTGIVGGGLVAVHVLGSPPALFEAAALRYLEPADLTMSLVKAAVFGFVLALVSCHQGFAVRGGAREVGAATTRAVVISLMAILASNYVLTAWLS